jgi:hypothetical protein
MGPLNPRRFKPSVRGPFFAESHGGDLLELPNGDILSVWPNYQEENTHTRDQETTAASLLRNGSDSWEDPCVFWEVPDRYTAGGQVALAEDGTLFHTILVPLTSGTGNNAVYWRSSSDNGRTWSRPKVFAGEYAPQYGGVEGEPDGSLSGWLIPAGRNAVLRRYRSSDGGSTWIEEDTLFLRGSHTGAIRRSDGSLLQVVGRDVGDHDEVPNALRRISHDGGETWTESLTDLPRVFALQMDGLTQLPEGPLAYVSFAEDQEFPTSGGGSFVGTGLFVALSYDEGETWPIKKLLTPGLPIREVPVVYGQYYVSSPWTAEPRGYLGWIRSRNGIYHVTTSANHYAFNLAWLEQLPEMPSLDLERRKELKATTSGGDRALSGRMLPPLRYMGLGITEAEATAGSTEALVRIDNPQGTIASWRADLEDVSASREAPRAITVEFTARVEVSSKPSFYRGLCLRLHVPTAENHDAHEFCVSRESLWQYRGKTTHPFARGLDNWSELHTYRMVVDSTRLSHVFRDGELIATLSPHRASKASAQRVAAGGPWGHPWPDIGSFLEVAAWGPARVEIESISWDLDNAWAPVRSEPSGRELSR